MFLARRVRLLFLVGMILLGVASATHAFEHWEIAHAQDCVAHTDKTSSGEKGAASHDHGCTVQDHAPALIAWVVFSPQVDCMADVLPVALATPSVLPLDIDHPPQRRA